MEINYTMTTSNNYKSTNKYNNLVLHLYLWNVLVTSASWGTPK